MALTREEIEQLAKEVADRVWRKVRPCSCGTAMWDSGRDIQWLGMAIGTMDPDMVKAWPLLTRSSIERVAEHCGVDMSQAEGYLDKIKTAVERADWTGAGEHQINLANAVYVPVADCAKREED